MRALKTFMRNRKKEMLACGPCECRTLQCWRYANENCGCGESKSSLPNYVKVEGDTIDGGGIQLFNDEPGNSLSVEIDTDTEEGGYRIVVGPFLIIEDENARFLWQNMWESLDAEQVIKLFGMDEGDTGVGHFTPEAMAQFNAFVNNPTEDQAASLKGWLESEASNGQLIVVFDE